MLAMADRWDHCPVHSDRFQALTKVIWCELDHEPTPVRAPPTTATAKVTPADSSSQPGR
jgi:hypothetical protein